MKKIILTILLITAMAVGVTNAQSITVNSPTITNSTCRANGEVAFTVITTPPLGKTTERINYRLIPDDPSIPIQGPVQNVGNIYTYSFMTLSAGKYTIEAEAYFSDASRKLVTRAVTVGGTYVTPQVTVNEWIPSLQSCDSTGRVYIRVTGGKAPIEVKIKSYAGASSIAVIGRIPDKIVAGGSGVDSYKDYYFYSLPSGNYEFEVSDDCEYNNPKPFTLNAINLKNGTGISWGRTCDWTNSCTSYYRAYPIAATSVPNYTNINNYYQKHPNITYQFTTANGYTSPFVSVKENHTLPTQYTENETWTRSSVTVKDPCGNELYTNNATETFSMLQSWSIYPSATANSCSKIRLYCGQYAKYTGAKYRIIYNGTTTEWVSITQYLEFETGFTDFKSLFASGKKTVTVEIENECGKALTKTVTINEPTINYGNPRWLCNTFYGGVYGASSANSIICLPAKIHLKNKVTGTVYTQICTTRGTLYKLKEVPAGFYEITLEGADGYSKIQLTNYEFKGLTPTVTPQTSTSKCHENYGYFYFSSVPPGSRIILKNSPNPAYYYDVAIGATSTTAYVYPDNNNVDNKDKWGIKGNYEFEIRDTCNNIYTLQTNLVNTYEVTEFDLTKGSETCEEGLKITPTGKILLGTSNRTAYFHVVSAPVGYIKPLTNITNNTPFWLTLKGTYVIGISAATSGCVYRTQSIYYDGNKPEIDVTRSLAYVCPGDLDSEGKIYVKAIYGQEPYTYYISQGSTGGIDVTTGLVPNLGTNQTGDFSAGPNLAKGNIYDVTIKDNCGTVIVQKFKVGDLQELTLAHVEKSTICVGEPIKFKAMGLPNPTYKWYKPSDYSTVWSTEQSPTIPSAGSSDGGTYKVEITTSLCVARTVTIEIPVTVIPPPTLIRSGGDADQNICESSNINNIVYTWGGSATDASVSGIPSSNYIKNATNKTITITGSFNSTSNYTITTSGGGCDIATVTGTITVKIQPSVSLTTANSIQSVCLNTPISNIVYARDNTFTNDIAVVGLPTGVSGNFNGVALTISGTPTVQGAFNYTVTGTSSDPSNPCPPVILTGTITVTELPLAPTVPSPQLTCYNAIPVITFSNTLANATYNLYDAPNGSLLDTKLCISNGAKVTLTAATAIIAGTTYYVEIDVNGCVSSTKTAVVVNTVSLPNQPTITTNAPICSGANAEITIKLSSSALSYTVYDAATNGSIIASTVVGNGADLLLDCGAIFTAKDFYIEVKNSNNCTPSAGRLKVVFTIDTPTEPIAVSPQFTCYNSVPSITITNTIKDYTYNLYTEATNGTIIDSKVSSVNGSSIALLPAAAIIADTDYYIEAVSMHGCKSTRKKVTVNLHNSPAQVNIISNSPLCKNDNAKITITSSSASLSYTVYDAAINGSIVVSTIAGNGGNLLLDCGAIFVAKDFYVEVKNSNGCISTSGRLKVSFTIDVILLPTIINPQYACEKTIPIITFSTGTKANYTYKLWDNSMSQLLDSEICSADGSTVSLSTSTAILGNTTYYIETLNANGCHGRPYEEIVVQAYSLPAQPSIVTNSPACKGTNAKITVLASSLGLIYTVYSDATNNVIIVSSTPGNGGNLILDCGIINANNDYYLQVSTSNGCVADGGRMKAAFTVINPPQIYPDIRVEACPTNNPINLAKYVDIEDFVSIKWEPGALFQNGGINDGTLLNPNLLVPKDVHTFKYTITNKCVTTSAKLYMQIVDNVLTKLPPETVVLCYEEAEKIQLNQIFGIEGHGSFSADATVEAYITTAIAPLQYAGASIFNGKSAYLNLPASYKVPGGYNLDMNAKKVEITYTAAAGNCFSTKVYNVTIILTNKIIP